MSAEKPYLQLQMIFPKRLEATPPTIDVRDGYCLRTYQRGDEKRFFELMDLVGWQGWDQEKLDPWMRRIPPKCWFMAIEKVTGKIVATAMGLQDHSPVYPFGGELGWVACDPAHRGQGLGAAVSAAVTGRLLAGGYDHIHLYTEHYRLAALKSYFNIGYVPFFYMSGRDEYWRAFAKERGLPFNPNEIYQPIIEERWRTICEQLNLPFTPNQWGY